MRSELWGYNDYCFKSRWNIASDFRNLRGQQIAVRVFENGHESSYLRTHTYKFADSII